jgi:hypothetical protein
VTNASSLVLPIEVDGCHRSAGPLQIAFSAIFRRPAADPVQGGLSQAYGKTNVWTSRKGLKEGMINLINLLNVLLGNLCPI